MIRNIVVFSFVTAILLLPLISFADPSVGGINTAAMHSGSIAVTNKWETGVPGYLHQKYTFVHPDCSGPQIVDYYGPAVDPNDPNLFWTEHQMCLRHDGG